MPHGLSVAVVEERMAEHRPIWVRPLSERNKSKKPLKLVKLSGPYAIVEKMLGARQAPVEMRVALDKLEFSKPPGQPEPKAEKPVVLPPLRVVTPPPAPAASIEVALTPKPEEVVVSHAGAQAAKFEAPTFVVFDESTKRFYTAAHKWTWNLDEARLYEIEGGANRAAGRLMGSNGKSRGKKIVVLSKALAKTVDRGLSKETPPPIAEAPKPPPETTTGAPAVEVTVAPQLTADRAPEIHKDIAAMQLALEHAMRAEAEAKITLLARQQDILRIQLEMDLFASRRRLVAS